MEYWQRMFEDTYCHWEVPDDNDLYDVNPTE